MQQARGESCYILVPSVEMSVKTIIVRYKTKRQRRQKGIYAWQPCRQRSARVHPLRRKRRVQRLRHRLNVSIMNMGRVHVCQYLHVRPPGYPHRKWSVSHLRGNKTCPRPCNRYVWSNLAALTYHTSHDRPQKLDEERKNWKVEMESRIQQARGKSCYALVPSV